jgi:hypothetical protein
VIERVASWVGPLLWCLATSAPTPGADTDPAAPGSAAGSPAVVALSAEVAVERALLEEDLARYRAAGRRRSTNLPRLVELYAALESALGTTEPAGGERIRAVLDQIAVEEAEGERARGAEREIAERIAARTRRIALLEQQIAGLDRAVDADVGPIAGVWDVSLLPFGQRGAFTLKQSGALISGTYELDGGFHGSLQGTLVNRKVFLVRIDSKLGRSMELEGYLASDGRTIRGNWLNYELAGTQAGTGQWTATRR